MEIDFNQQCEVPYEGIRFYATYETEETPAEPDVNWPGGRNIIFSEYTIEIPSRNRHRRTKVVTSQVHHAVEILRLLARAIDDVEVEPFAEMTVNQIEALEAEELDRE